MSGFHIDERFDLPVDYNGKEILLAGRLVRRGYSYRIHIDVDGQDIIFEPDEGAQPAGDIRKRRSANKISLELMRAIGEALEKHLR